MSEEQSEIVEERVIFERNGLRLSGVLAYPAVRDPERLILFCGPHPNFAGDMENNVIVTLARGLAPSAVTLRFDYHGVGASQIGLPPGVSVFDYWQELEESHDYSAAVADVAAAARFLEDQASELALNIVGYSFGAATGLRHGLVDMRANRLAAISPPLARVDFSFLTDSPKPCLLLCGSQDFVCRADDLQALAARGGPQVHTILLEGQDHFFRGSESDLLRNVAEFMELAANSSANSPRSL